MNLRPENNAILILCSEKEVLRKEINCVALTIDPSTPIEYLYKVVRAIVLQ